MDRRLLVVLMSVVVVAGHSKRHNLKKSEKVYFRVIELCQQLLRLKSLLNKTTSCK